MFDSLSNALGGIFDRLRGAGKLNESNVRDALREVRMALLEADVNFQVARDFIERVTQKCLGEEVLGSITPGQQIVKRVHDELIVLLGSNAQPPDLNGTPAVVMLVGLHGSGKTTSAGKLAAHWKSQGRNVLVVAADIRRPAAVEQLTVLARQAGVEIITPQAGESVPALGARALKAAWDATRDIVIFDTGGRFQIDADLVAELKDLQAAIKARNVLLVVDAAIGQESVHVAEVFHKEVGLTGLILTKLDGDARGGAALSIHAVTGCPIVFTGTGEHQGDLEPFHPERMASRILGMGDVISLVEKAQLAADPEAISNFEKRLKSNRFDLQDFLEQIQQMKKMGPMENLLDLLPMGGRERNQMRSHMASGGADQMKGFVKRNEAIIRSMTPGERRNPDIIKASRRQRIARGSGTTVTDVNDLLRQFDQARKMARQFGRMQKRLQWMR